MLRMIFIMVFTVALAATGFGHKFDQSDADLQAYLAVGGTLDGICGGNAAHDANCDTCRLIGGADLPRQSAVLCRDDAKMLRLAYPPVTVFLAATADRARQARAPPFV